MEELETIEEQLYSRVLRISESKGTDQNRDCFDLRRIFIMLLHNGVEDSEVYLSTHFSRLSFLAGSYGWHRDDKYLLHKYRRVAETKEKLPEDQEKALGIYANRFLLHQLYNLDSPDEISRVRLLERHRDVTERIGYKRIAHVQLMSEKTPGLFIAVDETNAHTEIEIDLSHTNSELFHSVIDDINETLNFPVHVTIHNVDITEENIYLPRSISLEPDYLFNVTDIANAYSGKKSSSYSYIINKFLPHESNEYLVLGNIVNYFLDRLIHNDKLIFEELFKETFLLYPLEYSTMADIDVKKLYEKARPHFFHLLRTVREIFPTIGIPKKYCQVEPSFYSEQYGLQGRLDLLVQDPRKENLPYIIELKSGKPFMANTYGIGNSHYVQTLLYDLLIRSASEHKKTPQNFILYSSLNTDALRSAPAIKMQQDEALRVRNDLYIAEFKLRDENDISDLLEWTSAQNTQNLIGFTRQNVEKFHQTIQKLSNLEKIYFRSFVAFISREQHLTKVGETSSHHRRGNSSLWKDSIEDKIERFEILSYLEITDTKLEDQDHFVHLRLSPKTNRLSNFRTGDIAVLYPFTHPKESAVRNQILKGAIVEINKDTVIFRLRHPQLYMKFFKDHSYWNLEVDSMDSGFKRMYQGLYSWAQSKKEKRNLVLGITAPSFGKESTHSWDPTLSERQQKILAGLTSVRDYALVWGPPGTGKTSQILKNYVDYLVNETEENILLIAYTNRAVDEIASVLEQKAIEFIRIGSRYSTAERYRKYLLQEKIKSLSNRKGIRNLIDISRVFICTLASLLGKQEIFKLKKFDTVLIDEASQILEPSLMGLLPRFKKWILIGDHNQLPAVVRQNRESAKVNFSELKDIGISNHADSLFERLIYQAKERHPHAIFELHEQGRMHLDIMEFPNQEFYSEMLTGIPGLDRLSQITIEKLNIIAEKRVAYLHVPSDSLELISKFNKSEAVLARQIVESLLLNSSYKAENIGIICPFRAQVAMIRSQLESLDMDCSKITVDTVERYQGSAKDVVILSMTVHHRKQLAQIISFNEEQTVDRKFNVALTRARERLIVIGNERVLRTQKIYARFIDQFKVS